MTPLWVALIALNCVMIQPDPPQMVCRVAIVVKADDRVPRMPQLPYQFDTHTPATGSLQTNIVPSDQSAGLVGRVGDGERGTPAPLYDRLLRESGAGHLGYISDGN